MEDIWNMKIKDPLGLRASTYLIALPFLVLAMVIEDKIWGMDAVWPTGDFFSLPNLFIPFFVVICTGIAVSAKDGIVGRWKEAKRDREMRDCPQCAASPEDCVYHG